MYNLFEHDLKKMVFSGETTLKLLTSFIAGFRNHVTLVTIEWLRQGQDEYNNDCYNQLLLLAVTIYN